MRLPHFTYSDRDDINDGKPWTADDDAELTNEAKSGSTLREAAEFLCRSGSLWDVLAINRQIEHRKIADSPLRFEFAPDGPHVFWPQRWLGTGELSFVPRLAL
jgi:hypothetical protein